MIVPLVNPQPTKGARMVTFRKRRKARKSRSRKAARRAARRNAPRRKARVSYRARRRHNPARAKVRRSRRVHKARRRRRTAISAGKHRPLIFKRGGKLYRSKRSKFFSGPTMINPRRRRRRGYRRNPFNVKALLNKDWLMTIASFSGGMVLGTLALPVINKLVPATSQTKVRPYLGLAHVILGGLLAGFVKNKRGREVGLGVAAIGVYDVIAHLLPTWQLPTIPDYNPLASKLFPASAPVAQAASGFGASYRPLAASYEAPGSRMVGLHGDPEVAAIYSEC